MATSSTVTKTTIIFATFTEWLESNGWGYAGMSLPVTEEEDIEVEIEKILKNDHYKKWGTFLLPDNENEEGE